MKYTSYLFLGSLLFLVGTALWTIFFGSEETPSSYTEEDLGI